MLIDLTPPVSSSLAIWPGDTPPSREVLLDMKRGDNITLSTLRATVHLGAHVDAPSHYGVDGRTMERQPLDLYVGACQVLEVAVARGARIEARALDGKRITAPRILFKTGTFPDPARFNDDFAALSPALVERLAAAGVKLVGIDTPSVDLFSSKDLPAHHACLAHDMAILEGIALAGVDEGAYELIALPLRLVGFDASPVRAVLRRAG